jgi:hypothetical protein
MYLLLLHLLLLLLYLLLLHLLRLQLAREWAVFGGSTAIRLALAEPAVRRGVKWHLVLINTFALLGPMLQD